MRKIKLFYDEEADELEIVFSKRKPSGPKCGENDGSGIIIWESCNSKGIDSITVKNFTDRLKELLKP